MLDRSSAQSTRSSSENRLIVGMAGIRFVVRINNCRNVGRTAQMMMVVLVLLLVVCCMSLTKSFGVTGMMAVTGMVAVAGMIIGTNGT